MADWLGAGTSVPIGEGWQSLGTLVEVSFDTYTGVSNTLTKIADTVTEISTERSILANVLVGVANERVFAGDSKAGVNNELVKTFDTQVKLSTLLLNSADLHSAISRDLAVSADSTVTLSNELSIETDTRVTIGNSIAVSIDFDTSASISNTIQNYIDTATAISRGVSRHHDLSVSAHRLLNILVDTKSTINTLRHNVHDTRASVIALVIVIQSFDTQVRVNRSIELLTDLLVVCNNSTITPADIENIIQQTMARMEDQMPTVTEISEGVWGAISATTLMDQVLFLSQTLKNKREVKKIGNTWTLLIYADDEVTPILSKPLKDFNGAQIADLAGGVLAIEEASDV